MRGPARGAFTSLFQAVAVAIDREDLRSMDEPIDESYDAGSIGEDLVPLAKGFVGRQHQWTAQLVTARDDLEQQVRVARVIGQISHFIHAQYGGLV